MSVEQLPALNATFNGISTVLIMIAIFAIKVKRDAHLHRKAILAASTSSGLFLISYLIYHFNIMGPKAYEETGFIRVVYYTILITHTILAVALIPLYLMSMTRALKGRFKSHRKIARLALPVWLYVSFTGVVIYLMAHLFQG